VLPIIAVSAAALVDADGRALIARRPPGKAVAWATAGQGGLGRSRF